MRTTLKRGVGRGADANGSGRSVFPPAAGSTVARYEQPQDPPRSGWKVARRLFVGLLLVVLSLVTAAGGGAYLWGHESIERSRGHSEDVKSGAEHTDVKMPGQAAIALVVGYDVRQGAEHSDVSRSDTIMLIRADPDSKTISTLSFPRDLQVEIHCPGQTPVTDRINAAYARCGSKGTLETVKQLTGLPINYLITVNFQGFREIIDKLGGIWVDVDHRYYNRNVGTADTNYADINLKPGYQRLNGRDALSFVRFRHTDSDFLRVTRQQIFVNAFRQQIAQEASLDDLREIVNVITRNVEVGTKSSYDFGTVASYARFAAELPGGNYFQVKVEDVTGYAELYAPESSIQKAVSEFANPDANSAKVANATALGRKIKTKTPAPKDTTVTVLNGNGIQGSAAAATYLLAQRGYEMLLPPGGAQPDAPIQDYFRSQIYFDPKQKGAKEAAKALQKLVAPSDVRPIPGDEALRALNPGSMLMLVVGTAFHNKLSPAPVVAKPERGKPNVRFDPEPGRELLAPFRKKVPFTLMVPTVLESNSQPDSGSRPYHLPARLYWMDDDHKTVRLVFSTGLAGEYWGIQQTDWEDAPVLSSKSFTPRLSDGRRYELHYSGTSLRMVVLRQGNATYWVTNTLGNKLSNETMLAIAKGLKPLRGK